MPSSLGSPYSVQYELQPPKNRLLQTGLCTEPYHVSRPSLAQRATRTMEQRGEQAWGDRRRTCAAHRPRRRDSPSHKARLCCSSSFGRPLAETQCRWRVWSAIPGRASAARFVRARGGSDRPPDQILRLLPVFPSWNWYRCTCLAPLLCQFCFSRGGTCGAVSKNRSSTNPASRTHKNDGIYVIHDQC